MRLRLALGALALALSGCSILRMERYLMPRPDDWPTFARTVTHTAAGTGTIAPPLALEWSQDVAAGTGTGSPVVMDSIVFVGTLRGELYAVAIATGKSIGAVSLGDAIQGSPVIDGNVAFVALANTPLSLVAYDLVNGLARWKKSYGDLEVTPLLYRGRIYMGNTSGIFFCAERATGDMRWKFEIPDNTTLKGIRSSPAADSGTVVFGTDDGRIYALDAETGARRWVYETGAPVQASPLIDSLVVYVGNIHGTVCAIDLLTGRPRWSSSTGAPVYANAVPAHGVVVVGNLAGQECGFRERDGKFLWRTSLEGPVNSGVVLAGGTMYVGTMKKLVYGLNPEDGAITWEAKTDGRIKTSGAAAFGRLLFTTDEHDLIAYREAR